MKAYTDIEQSKNLAKILPIESADMWWVALNWQETEYYVEVKQDGINQPKKAIPAWSLAALLVVLPSVIKRKGKRMFLTLEKAGAYNLYYKSPNRLDEIWETKEEPIDACVEMIIELNKMGVLWKK